jgi:hypothetical protein
MIIEGTYKVHLLEKVLPKKIPKKINNIQKLFDTYGVRKNPIEFPANSLVVAFIPGVFCQLNNANIANVTDTANVLRTVVPTSICTIAASQAGGSEAAYGLVLGTGNTAVTLNDYKLGTVIAHGNGAGQLNYNIMNIAFYFPFKIVGSSAQWSILRPITNFSGNDIVVKEAGIYFRCNSYNFCIERTVLGTEYTFVKNTSVVMEYIVKVTV